MIPAAPLVGAVTTRPPAAFSSLTVTARALYKLALRRDRLVFEVRGRARAESRGAGNRRHGAGSASR